MSSQSALHSPVPIKEPHNLSERIQRLRDFYFSGIERSWNNEFTCWTTGTPWDVVYDEMTFYIVPETYPFMQPFRASTLQVARQVGLPDDFWSKSLVERRAWFIKEVMVNYLPQEILPGDLLAGARFNILASRCWSEKEAKERDRLIYGSQGSRARMKWFHSHGYGNAGATSGHLIPDHQRALEIGWKGIHQDLEARLNGMSVTERRGPKGAQLRAMLTASTMARDLAARYASRCRELARQQEDEARKAELEQMADQLDRVPWEPAQTFWEAVQALWLNHMLIMADENYPGPGVSFGRIDQLLYPYWSRSIEQGMDREWGKEILKCFWIHANTAYDAMIRVGGNQGITSGYGQLITLSGMGAEGRDLTNDLTYAMLEVIDELSPLLEPKPNVRLHANSPEELLDRLVEMIATSQGAPFLINFDERSMAGLLRQARRAGVEHLIHQDNVFDYAPVGCLENTMVGNDRSGTVDINLNLLKAVELTLTGGKDMHPVVDPITGKTDPVRQDGPATGDPRTFSTWERFWEAYAEQTRHLIARSAEVYEASESIRARFCPTPYLSCLVRGCAEKGLDITQGGPELNFVTVEGVTFATTVDSLLAIKHLVYDTHQTTMDELIRALTDNWKGHEMLQARARYRAPKYGQDNDEADEMAFKVMELWTDETWTYQTRSTGRRFRPGMLSWNYWVSDGDILAASADGRPKGQFLSNAICPSNGADILGPTANSNSVGKALGGRATEGEGDFAGYFNSLPNGASHTITFSSSLLRDREHKEKFKAFLRGYCDNGGTCLQVNMVDVELLKEAQKHPEQYRHLLVRVTGYNAYFTGIGRELQDEIIARESHKQLG
ncbi:MAG: hypothetical protein JW797_03860 [Bradymonadales bacterium]|nr:hypothetical protein [Bradymonadales bacterium]